MSDPNFLLIPRRCGVWLVVPDSPDSRRPRRSRSPDVEEVGESVSVSCGICPLLGLSELPEVEGPGLFS